jgi:hypothetical protein
MADPVVVAVRAAAAAMAESAATMSTGGIDYTNFDEQSYHFSSTSKKENESRYLCNMYRMAGETAQWGTCRQSLNLGGTTPGERCPGTLIIKHDIGMSRHNHPYVKVEHKCVDNRKLTLAVARGVIDNRPQLERILPNIKNGNYLLRQGIEEVLREFSKAEKNDKNLWQNITGGNTMRKWIPDMYDNNVKRVALKGIIEKALEGYITIVQERYPALKYFKVGALKSLPGAELQFVGHGGKLHSDYPQSVEELESRLRPVSIIVGLNSFKFMWLNDRTSRESEIRKLTVYPGEMIMFTNHCLHAGGENSTNEEQTRLFAYLASDESHFPSGEVTTWDWQRGDNNPLISKPSRNTNTALVKRPGTNQIRLIRGRVARVGGTNR